MRSMAGMDTTRAGSLAEGGGGLPAMRTCRLWVTPASNCWGSIERCFASSFSMKVTAPNCAVREGD